MTTDREKLLILRAAAQSLMNYLAFMQGTRNRKFPFRPSPEGEAKLAALAKAIQDTKGDE